MESSFFSRIITEKPRLFRAILRFNNRLAAFPRTQAMLDSLPSPLGDALRADPLLLRELRRTDAAGRYFWDFEDETSRLALLETDSLQKLFLLFAASVWGEDISHIIIRKEREDLTAAIGADAYLFALKRGRFLTGHLHPFFSALQREDPLEEKIAATRKNVFSVLCSRWPAELRAACAPMLEDSGLFPPDRELSVDAKLFTSVWHAAKKILIREVDPQCAPCFD